MKKSLGSGIFYTAISRYSGVIVTIVIGAVLARLLNPSEFGIVALVTVFVSFFSLLSDFGLGPAIIQNQELSEWDLQSIFSFSVILAIFLSLFFFLSAPIISNFYGEPDLLIVTRYLSLAVLFNSLSVVPKSLLLKSLDFKKVGLFTVATQLFSGVVAILMAFLGYTYYSLVVQSILLGAISFLIFFMLRPISVRWKVDLNSIGKIVRFSSFQFMFNLINYFSRNADNILIGKYLSLTSLGFYDKGYRLMLMPVQNLTHVITPVLTPVLSKHQNDLSMVFRVYLQLVNILAIVGFPLSVFLYFAAPELIQILYGEQWLESVPIFKLLTLTIGIQIILSSCGSIFQVVNRTDLLFVSGLVSAILMVSGICYGIFVGKSIIAVGHGLIFALAASFFQSFYILIKLALKSSLRDFFYFMVYPVFIALVMGFFLFIYEFFIISNIGLSISIKLFISGVIFTVLIWSKREYRDLLKIELAKIGPNRIQ